ncbi:MAG: glycosyltransferase family 39 protein [Acetatifactor sp.]|nr:glycosyltransferase family 39 protein [Acetatifactor sp.]MDE7045383.1 glycosyltransferase family 39 protein [Acetatifactor sp.]
MKRENKLIVAAVVLPLLVGVFFEQTKDYKLSSMHFFVLTALIVTYNGVLFLQRAEWERRKAVLQCSGMGFFTIGMIQGVCLLRNTENVNDSLRTVLGITLAVIVTAAFLFLLKVEKGVTENVIMLVIFAAFMIRIFYTVLTMALLYQNDLTIFHPDCFGHLGYVYRLYADGRLPDVNPTESYEFYQPPLHYAISAIYLRVLGLFRLLPTAREDIEEILQVLPMIYSMITIVYIDKIGKNLKLSPEGRLTAVCFAGFLPYSVMLGAALNNDPLAIMLMVMSIYYTLKWHEKPGMKGILIMALCIGCAMMAKVSSGLIAPAMAVMMLHRAWKDRKQWTVYLKQFTCFGLIAFPLGLWHSVYCFVRYRMPIGYIADLSEDSLQFIGNHDKWSRFFDFENAFEFLGVRMDYEHLFADYNIPVTLIKYATFGESYYYQSSGLTNVLGTGMFWVNAVLFILMAIAAVVWLFLRDGRMWQKIFLLTGAGVGVFSYLKFCIRYTHVCTMNVRYIMCPVYIGCIVTAVAAAGLQERIAGKSETGGRVWKRIMVSVSVLYAVAVIVLKTGMQMVVNF